MVREFTSPLTDTISSPSCSTLLLPYVIDSKEENHMYGVRRDLDYTRAADKKILHPLMLQQLKDTDFIKIVNGILAGDCGLLTYRRGKLVSG